MKNTEGGAEDNNKKGGGGNNRNRKGRGAGGGNEDPTTSYTILKAVRAPQEPVDLARIKGDQQKKNNQRWDAKSGPTRNSNISASTPRNYQQNRSAIKPLIPPEPQALMGIRLDRDPRESTENAASNHSLTSVLSHLSEKQKAANEMQRSRYYRSENLGHLPPTNEIIEKCCQFSKADFVTEKNQAILIDKKFDLMITSCSSRCNAISIRVKSQHQDDTFAVCALLFATSTEQEIREACLECIDMFSNTAYRKNERTQFSKCSEPYLTKCQIRPLFEPAESFPEALYYCNRCDFHINSVAHAKMHLEQSSHFDDVERQEQREKLLRDTPQPSREQYLAATNYLNAIVEEERKKRKISTEKIAEILDFLSNRLFPSLECNNFALKPFGSTQYDVFLADSDLNIAFFIDDLDMSQLFDFYGRIVETLNGFQEEIGNSADLVTDGSNSQVSFNFRGEIVVRLCSGTNTICKAQLCFTNLMKVYTQVNPAICEFMMLVRLWAVKVGIDSKNKQRVGLPRYGFDIISIHYLQQSGHLPVLHELVEKDSEEQQENVIEEARERRIRQMSNYLSDIQMIKSRFESKKSWEIGKIWISFLKYLIEKHRDIVIQITQFQPMSKEQTRWNKKSYHVVDPFRADNVLTIPKVTPWLSFYFNCVLSTFRCFAIPRNSMGSLVSLDFYQNKVSSPTKKSSQNTAKKKLQQQQETPCQNNKKGTTTPRLDTPTTAEKQMDSNFDEQLFNAEIRRKSLEILETLRFDNVPCMKLTAEHTEIDEHRNSMYSRRTMIRVRRICGRIEEVGMLESLMKEGLLKKKRKKSARKLVGAFSFEAAEIQEDEVFNFEPLQKEAEAEIADDAEIVAENFDAEIPTDEIPSENPSPAEIFKKNLEKRSATPPVESSWQHWSSQYSTPEDASSAAATWRPVFSTPTTDLAENLENSLKITKKPPCEFGEFQGPSNFLSKTAAKNEIRAVDDLICYEEFFIRQDFDERQIRELRKGMGETDYRFTFEPKDLTGGYEMEVKCSSCDGNHIVDNCPSMEIPPVEKFAKRTKEEIRELDEIIDKYYQDNTINESRLRLLENQVKNLENHLRSTYRKDVVLTIFGSVMTGIGVNKSDIDVCLRFGQSYEQPEDRDAERKLNLAPVDVISQVAEKLRRAKMTRKVQPILTAKVPIVKFQLKLDYDLYVDADISYYNILALYNTKLLRSYTLWSADNKFAKLGLFVKNWAKQCDIGDASKGSISSYAHIILLLSYLQKCDPQVLPRLQEDFRDSTTEKRIVENWDTYFYEGEPKPYLNNQKTCAELLLGFFDYYSRFDFRHFVIQCRREENLSKLEKQWTKPLSIEDPFDLHHNLGSGVTRKMFAFIHRTFICSRKVFMSAKIRDTIPRDDQFIDNYRRELLRSCSQGHAPSDRQCHICAKIGHFAESCPKRIAQREAKRNRFSSVSTVGSSTQNAGGSGYHSSKNRPNFSPNPNNNTPKKGGSNNKEQQEQKKVDPKFLEYHKRTVYH
ncbi:unnamed protein product [Caenorhabditis angaria]|uniref:CCHC-type domain-containing protein n=1 Tax=Caenorhabditis angaria TaxID=860376 RepID=A0A9P1IER9_9PELO|nr:unnamed protein product [Caenorhabditis angaria]